jgi:hypothetical protein
VIGAALMSAQNSQGLQGTSSTAGETLRTILASICTGFERVFVWLVAMLRSLEPASMIGEEARRIGVRVRAGENL